jgi:hypothetical protein
MLRDTQSKCDHEGHAAHDTADTTLWSLSLSYARDSPPLSYLVTSSVMLRRVFRMLGIDSFSIRIDTVLLTCHNISRLRAPFPCFQRLP